MINREELVRRHNPILEEIDLKSPLTVGNGEFAFSADVTGLQTLYDEYAKHHNPLCTMSQWGWHTKPVDSTGREYTLADLDMTEYDFNGRTVRYAVEKKSGNEHVYDWLRTNPHKMNLARIGILFDEAYPEREDIAGIRQELDMFTGALHSTCTIKGEKCDTETICDSESDTLAVSIKSAGIAKSNIKIALEMSYGSPEMTGADFSVPDMHESDMAKLGEKLYTIKRTLDADSYYITIGLSEGAKLEQSEKHKFIISNENESDTLSFSVRFSKSPKKNVRNFKEVAKNAAKYWKGFWENGAVVQLYKSKDKRGFELERRIVLSQYLLAIQSGGSLPPQETGLTCNSWYGKYHLEMTIWHQAQFPLWNHTALLERSLPWYLEHLEEAKENAARNGYQGARWPKMVAYQCIDCPSPIATLLIWQQPHILWLLWLSYARSKDTHQLAEFEELIYETAEFMADYPVYNSEKDCYDLCAPLIPAQECHKPRITKNPTYELEYWRYGLNIAIEMLHRLGRNTPEKWSTIAEKMAKPTINEGLYMAHENCPDTFRDFAKDHPSMLLAYGLLPGDRLNPEVVGKTLDKVLEVWDYTTMWGWDFALMAMTATRLGKPEQAIDALLTDTPKNSYVKSGNNNQTLRTDLPLYLPGNGSLLLAVAMMVAGYEGCEEETPGIPKNGMWEVEYEGLQKLM